MGTPASDNVKNVIPGAGKFNWKGEKVNCQNLLAAAKAQGAKAPNSNGCCEEGYHKIQILKEPGEMNFDDPNAPDFHVLRGGRCGGVNTSLFNPGGGEVFIIKDADAEIREKYSENCGTLCAPGN